MRREYPCKKPPIGDIPAPYVTDIILQDLLETNLQTRSSTRYRI
ncbi:MAG: hypothetical protein ACTSP4_12335 [Candidatus Hodarchaeales archaeon]